ncbi:sensor histidine kinase YesM [Wenyingzhuangia heitensis]|uniref:Sensor histidine kinase YesM n=1 Tax=Wenyingzhuangia heitensis TaxID=1487859 RepID=A0ABX0UCJ8_9FLAO|nr:histidine kinase [Wenyingzhuangia heitensis]NIJ44777.1 sensor histidine kinase YesM [Wenyingzhuangia heitensis]
MSLYKSNVPSYFFLALCLLTYAWSDLWMLEQITVNQYIRAVVLLKDPVVTSLFIAGFYLFYYFKKLNQKSEEQLEIAYQKLEKTQKGELAHLQLKSLKAQMNPHFMFNAMNSIQSMVLKGDKHNAYQYLSKFSEMVRDNLNMSEKSFVSFDEENSLLKKYLELEKLRFRNDFSYKITGGNLVDDLKIPSMIIQPFVENAIKHGLLHKVNGQKQLHIEFKQKEVFECIITDNGVGVQKCKEINIQNKIEHTSFSTNAIKERLALLKDYYKTDIGFEYIAVAKGTQVVVKIPYTLK